eukprot:GILJ01011317.1.p1 GENE.GILJ01011317.1~~GILJ01011317.1.p1  ORF type:complete len:829 (-),score=157.87 GILJ01011317.1:37-2448(-)
MEGSIETKEEDHDLLMVEQELVDVRKQIRILQQREKQLLELQETIVQFSEANKKQNKSQSSNETKPTTDWAATFPWESKVMAVLQDVFGLREFRTHQREVINATLSGKDCFLVMPTGGGKSLCFQLPAILSAGTVIVISPLLSLIQDQVMSLQQANVYAVMLTSFSSKEEVKTTYMEMLNPNSKLKLIYVTPERIAKSKMFLSKLEKMHSLGRLSRIVIDEAHCCSQWGHDFRPDYRTLGILKRQFKSVPIIALTATATPAVAADVKAMLQINRCEFFKSSFNRPNLYYQVRSKPKSHDEVIEDMYRFITEHHPKDSGIVYCFSRKESEQVAIALQEKGIACSCYHADMNPEHRQLVHQQWSRNEIMVVVATIAFGMGINKPDVRFVMHHTLSKSLEGYYQESGRAGRDGVAAQCIIYYRAADTSRQSTMVFAEESGLRNLYRMVKFCEDLSTCRRVLIGQYFGEPFSAVDCGMMCDNCAEPKELIKKQFTDESRKVVQIVQELSELEEKVTMLQLMDTLKGNGKKAAKVRHIGTCLKETSKDDIERLLVWLIINQFLQEEFHHTPYSTNSYVICGKNAKGLLNGQFTVELDFPVDIKSGKVRDLEVEQDPNRLVIDKLKELRVQLARQHVLYPHIVLNEAEMTSLARNAPTSMESLSSLLPSAKVAKYGTAILSYLEGLDLEQLRQQATVKETEKKKQKRAPSKKRKRVVPLSSSDEEDGEDEDESHDDDFEDGIDIDRDEVDVAVAAKKPKTKAKGSSHTVRKKRKPVGTDTMAAASSEDRKLASSSSSDPNAWIEVEISD